jgi:antitoxin YefM
MLTVEAQDMQGVFKMVFDLARNGEAVKVEGPSDKVVVMSESEYDEMAKAKHNAEYIAMLERSKQQIREGKVIFKTIEELRALER